MINDWASNLLYIRDIFNPLFGTLPPSRGTVQLMVNHGKKKRTEVRHLLAIVHYVNHATTVLPLLFSSVLGCNTVHLVSVSVPFFEKLLFLNRVSKNQ